MTPDTLAAVTLAQGLMPIPMLMGFGLLLAFAVSARGALFRALDSGLTALVAMPVPALCRRMWGLIALFLAVFWGGLIWGVLA